ncbi:MAG TPA: hypothetical protein VGP52_13705 [Stellaceae bacterium]|nr:hypothetical protein [Stellaceae bacterium]
MRGLFIGYAVNAGVVIEGHGNLTILAQIHPLRPGVLGAVIEPDLELNLARAAVVEDYLGRTSGTNTLKAFDPVPNVVVLGRRPQPGYRLRSLVDQAKIPIIRLRRAAPDQDDYW